MPKDLTVCTEIWELNRELRGYEETKCMKQTFIRNSQSLNCVKTFFFVFDKAVFQYSAYNSKSLIAMLSQKNTIHIVSTKAIFGK
jgi:hypothetical protein